MPPAGSSQGVGGSVNSDEEDSDAAGSVELDDEDMDIQLNGQTFDMSDDDPAEDESPPDSDSDSPEDSEPEGVEILGQKPSRTVAAGAKLNGEQTLSELNLMPPGFGQFAVGCGLIGQKTVDYNLLKCIVLDGKIRMVVTKGSSVQGHTHTHNMPESAALPCFRRKDTV